ncbi:hypothetical protein DRJ25_04775 [Candidatus Woesearchaeota archaeon]|nr:MAG: hypothetical protein DRJ25_04775 [Candidatus Woesearchaeota archaeon]
MLKKRNKITETGAIASDWRSFFPYIKIRPLQEQIIKTLNKSYGIKHHAIIQAANGVGKTIAILSSILPKAIENGKHVVYCCRTHQQLGRVIEELKMIKQLKDISAVALKGRQELCLHKLVTKYAVDSSNAAEICTYLKKEGKCKFFANLGKRKVKERVISTTKQKVIGSDELLELGKSLDVCPFEMSKLLISTSHVIVVNYQHIFNPHINKVLLSYLEKDLSDIVLIIDEAHNLPSVAIDISSSSLSYFTINHAIEETIKIQAVEAERTLKGILKVLKSYSEKLSIDEEMQIIPFDFLEKVEKTAKTAINELFIEELEEIGDLIKHEQLLRNRPPYSYCSSVARYFRLFLETKDRIDFAHFITLNTTKVGNVQPRLYSLCLDPSFVTKEIFDEVYFSVSLSGTLDPIEAYIKLIGLKENDVEILSLPSPYQKENILTLVVKGVSSKLASRTRENFELMLEAIKATIDATPKNVGIFCASYSIMESLLEHGLERSSTKPVFIAYQGMSSQETDELITSFKTEAKKKLGGVLLSVLGGRSSEGSDYPAEEMESVIIVGVPYAKPSPSVQASINYLESRFPKKGREFGYHIPALTRASQAAGRPIRSLQDYATVVLLDQRYAYYYYKRFLPVWLKENMVLVEPEYEAIKKMVVEFFKKHTY